MGPTTFTAHELPAEEVLGDRTVMEAFETATANSLHTIEVIKATMTEACSDEEPGAGWP